jgi:hypothetical protein
VNAFIHQRLLMVGACLVFSFDATTVNVDGHSTRAEHIENSDVFHCHKQADP